MKSNREAFKEFSQKLIDYKNTIPVVREMLIKLQDDEEFVTYLQVTAILMIRFPALFENVIADATMQLLLNRLLKDIETHETVQ